MSNALLSAVVKRRTVFTLPAPPPFSTFSFSSRSSSSSSSTSICLSASPDESNNSISWALGLSNRLMAPQALQEFGAWHPLLHHIHRPPSHSRESSVGCCTGQSSHHPCRFYSVPQRIYMTEPFSHFVTWQLCKIKKFTHCILEERRKIMHVLSNVFVNKMWCVYWICIQSPWANT